MKKTLGSFIAILFCFQLIFAQSITVKLIETSDIHGQLFPYDFTNDKPSPNSLAQIYTYVKQERAKGDQHVVLLDNGDILQGQPIVYYYNFVRYDTMHVLSSIMNFMNYDAATVGNHDIEAGHPVYDKLNEEFEFPWLAANAVNENTGEPYFEPYKIIDIEGIKIAVLGLITPHIPHWLPKNIWEGMYFEDMIESAQKWVDIINEKENPDLLVGLFHAGVDYTYGNVTADTYKNENASQLVAERVKGFDVIFVGHDHQGWNKLVPNNYNDVVLILGTKGYAATAAEATVQFNYNKELNEWQATLYGNIIDPSGFKPDEEFMQKFNYAFEQTKEYVSKPIGKLTRDISAKEALFGDAAFTDLVNKIQLDLTGADISFTAPLSFNAGINEGTIHVRDMFDLYKFENLLYTMELTGQEIKDYMEYTYALWFNEMKNENDHLLNFETDEKGNIKFSERSNSPMLSARYYNFDAAEGINYTVDVSQPFGKRVTINKLDDGNEFDFSRTYKVAVNSYRGNGGGGHLTKGVGLSQEELPGRIINSTERDLRYYLIEWIEQQKVISPKTTNNWKVIPEDWYEKAKEKDYRLLFE